MGKTEVEAWGEKDDPTEATAIFPPDEPMGWPAKDYKRATIDYLDGNARLVNVAHPGGAISTTEYNSKNDVERTLSPDNRATALKEGAKSAEKSKLLDTENTYNTEGTELQSTLGPQRTVNSLTARTLQRETTPPTAMTKARPPKAAPTVCRRRPRKALNTLAKKKTSGKLGSPTQARKTSGGNCMRRPPSRPTPTD